MKDSAAKGIKTAQQAGQLRKDAAVQRKKASVGKRGSSSTGGVSKSSSTPSSNSTSISGSSSSTVRSSNKTSNLDNRNFTRKTQNKQTIDKAINVAKRIPVANKYAKMAEKIRTVQKKASGAANGISMKMDEKADVNKEDVEEALRSEQAGEEYKPDAAEGKYTAITARMMIFVVIFIFSGVLFVAMFFCIIILSSVTTSAGEA